MPAVATTYVAASGVEHAQHNQDQFRLRRAAFYFQLKSKVGNILAKTCPPLTDACLAEYRSLAPTRHFDGLKTGTGTFPPSLSSLSLFIV